MGVKGYAIHLSFSPGNGVLMRDNTPKSTRTQGGDPIADYIRADTRLPAYLPYPRFLLKMEISQTAKLLYSLLLDRSTLSQKNKWLDDEGRIYIIYPIAEIAEILDKGSTTIKGALNELDTAGLLERERGGFSAPNRLYVKVPPVPQVQFSDQLMAGSPPLIEPENRPTDGQKTDLMMVGKPSPNQTTINNLTESQTKGVSGGPSAPYGRYGNIFLSQTEYDELQAEYPDRLERFIEEMSRYLAANGKSYQNYAAVLRTHIINYAKTRDTYVAYRKTGYSKKFREEHEEEILLHQAAKNAFDDMGVKKLPKVKELQAEYARLLEEKKKTYAEYRRSREEMRELLAAKANVDRLLKMEAEHDAKKEKDHDQR